MTDDAHSRQATRSGSGDKKSRRSGRVEKKSYVPGSRGRPPKWFNEIAATEAAAIISKASAAVSSGTEATRCASRASSADNSTAEPAQSEPSTSSAESSKTERSK
jgi:hypothetical protein